MLPPVRGICSAGEICPFGQGVRVIGERINPTGKKRFQQALREGDMNYIVAQAVERPVAHGAEQIGPDGSRDAEFPGMLPDVRKGVQYDLFGRGAVTEPVGREPAKRGVITVEQLPKGGGSPPLG